MIDHELVAAVLRDTAKEEILPRFQKLEKHEVGKKQAGEIVTIADTEAEKRLSESLERLLPGSVTVGEEGASKSPKILEHLEGEAPVWVIDPVDGTKNFAEGRERFAMIVALCLEQRTIAGWIHDPINDQTAFALLGKGVWLNGERLHVSSPRPLHEMSGSFYGPGVKIPGEGSLRRVRYGCVGHEYIDLASGRLDYARYRKLKPWDHAAGVLLHAEAGGYGALAGECTPYVPLPYQERNSLILASDEETWIRIDAFFNRADAGISAARERPSAPCRRVP